MVSTMDVPIFDTFAVAITPDKYGTFTAKRIYLRDGKVVHESELVHARVRSSALREMRMDLDLFSLQLSRQILELETPEPPKVRS